MDPNLKNQNLKNVCSRLPFIVMGIQSESVRTLAGNRENCVAETSTVNRKGISVTPNHYHSGYERPPAYHDAKNPDVIMHNNHANYSNNSSRMFSKNRAKYLPSTQSVHRNSVLLPHSNPSGHENIMYGNTNQQEKLQSFSENQLQRRETLSPSGNTNKYPQEEIHEKLEAVLVKMREKDDQISMLCTELTSLKEILYKNSTDNGSSKHLYQNLRADLGKIEKQLYSIEEKVEQQEMSAQTCYPRSSCMSSSSSSSCSSDVLFDYDRLIEGIKMLNLRAEAGHSLGVCFNSGGARFKSCDGIIVTLFKNGILLGSSDFMPFTGSRAKIFSQDIFDGYFPNEFQRQYPSGIVFVIQDKRKLTFNRDIKYSGDGYILKNHSDIFTDDLPYLVPGEHLCRLKTRQFTYPSYTSNDSIPSTSTSSSTHSICTSKNNIVEIPVLTASYGILLSKKNAGLDDKIIRIKLKNIKTGKCYKLKTSIFATVGEIINHLCCNVEEQQEENIELIHSSPIGILSCPQVVLKDYGIDSNILLYFRNVISQLT